MLSSSNSEQFDFERFLIGPKAGKKYLCQKARKDGVVLANTIRHTMVEQKAQWWRKNQNEISLSEEKNVHNEAPDSPVPITKWVNVLELGVDLTEVFDHVLPILLAGLALSRTKPT
jgi:hypothetical protein